MHYTEAQQLWLSWGQGEIDDTTAQRAVEASEAARKVWRGRGEGEPTRSCSRTSSVRPHGDVLRPGGLAPAGSASPSHGDVLGPRRLASREKVFGPGRCVPLDRNAKVRVMMLARSLSRRQEPGKAYGQITAKALAVLQALLWGFHNAASGCCYPSYEAIADRAGCARSTVYEAIRALEQIGVLSWVNRIKRVREWVPGLFGKASAWRWRVIRTSNSYVLADPLNSSKSDFPTGTPTQGFNQEKNCKKGATGGVPASAKGQIQGVLR